MSQCFCTYNAIQWSPVLFWTPLTFILRTKYVCDIHYIAKTIGSSLLMKGLTTLAISMSTNLNV